MDIEKQLYKLVTSGDVSGVETVLSDNSDYLNRVVIGKSWLHFAARDNDVEMIEALIDMGLDVNFRAHDCSIEPLFSAIFESSFEAITCLVEKGANINVGGGDNGATPLAAAVESGDLKIVKYLIENGAESDIVFGTPPNLHTARSFAVLYEREDIEDYLKKLSAKLP